MRDTKKSFFPRIEEKSKNLSNIRGEPSFSSNSRYESTNYYPMHTNLSHDNARRSPSPSKISYRAVDSIFPTSTNFQRILAPTNKVFKNLNKYKSFKIAQRPKIRFPVKIICKNQKFDRTIERFSLSPDQHYKKYLEIGCQIDIN